MHRTQIYLDDDEVALLTQELARTGASRSELIRRAVRSQYGADTPERRLAALRASAGIWSDRSSTGADYVEELRSVRPRWITVTVLAAAVITGCSSLSRAAPPAPELPTGCG